MDLSLFVIKMLFFLYLIAQDARSLERVYSLALWFNIHYRNNHTMGYQRLGHYLATKHHHHHSLKTSLENNWSLVAWEGQGSQLYTRLSPPHKNHFHLPSRGVLRTWGENRLLLLVIYTFIHSYISQKNISSMIMDIIVGVPSVLIVITSND